MLTAIWKNYSYVILLMGLALITSFIALMKVESTISYQKVTVQEGDSLWTISQELSEEHDLSTKEVMEWVSEKNNLATDIIRPGDSLIIPAEKSFLIEKDNYELASGTE
ncbi:cell division suppressor protein YneA [Bacillus sp. AK031]